ncbi:hypothetical protein R6Q59_016634 [Mikania micrantha]
MDYTRSPKGRIIKPTTDQRLYLSIDLPFLITEIDIRIIYDELVLAQSSIDKEGFILAQLGDRRIQHHYIIAAIRVQQHLLSYSELFNKLVNYEQVIGV